MRLLRTTVLLFALAVSGCAGLRIDAPFDDRGVDGVACLGTVDQPAVGLLASPNAALLQQARFPTGKGGICAGKVFSVSAPVMLFRVYDSSNPHSRFGGWWALQRPAGSRDDYRAAYAICPAWSRLDRLIACEVRPGTEIAIGTTQSVACDDGSNYPRTARNQVFVANDARAGIVHVGACSEQAIWP